MIFMDNNMSRQEKEILDYLETSYCGAKMADDENCMIRLTRAIKAFEMNPEEEAEIDYDM